MARSRNKHSRAALRAKARRPRRQGSSRWFTVTVTVVVLVGVVGVVLASGVLDRDDASAVAPLPPNVDPDNPSGDHWHAALGVNICGEWLPAPAEFETVAGNSGVRTGIHTHGDGFIHIHPFFASEGGENATLGRFLSNGGWSASRDSLEVWEGPSFAPDKTEWRNGDECPDGSAMAGRRGRVVFEINCKTVAGDPSDHKLADQEVVALGFLPRGEEMGAPPNAASAPAVDAAGDQPQPIDQAGCRPSAENNPGVVEPPPSTPTTEPSSVPTSQP